MAEEDIEEDSKLVGPWTKWDPRVLAKRLYQLTEKHDISMLAWKEKHHSGRLMKKSTYTKR